MYRPGAETSGFEKPSIVVPYADQSGTVSSLGSEVMCWSSAPTVITNGSLAGAYDSETGPLALPWLPAAATTTMPSSHSRSTALSSASARMLVWEAVASEKFATRMLYCFACASIQSAAEMTSLSSDSPCAFAVRIETIGAFGAPPLYRAPEPAATPATIVPWPSSSPDAVSGHSEHMLTLATNRVPKSDRACTPESTIAIAGACGAGPVISPVFGSNAFRINVRSVESFHIVESSYPSAC